MASERFTITLPARLAKRVRETAKKSKTPVSRVIAAALESQERAQMRELMIRGYRESADESVQFAEGALPLALENWPDK